MDIHWHLKVKDTLGIYNCIKKQLALFMIPKISANTYS